MSNPDCRQCAGLRMNSGCHPDPVLLNGATLETEFFNCGKDRYTVRGYVRIIEGKDPGASLTLHDGVSERDVITWFAGTFGAGRGASWPHSVQRCPNGTAKGHSIRTIAEFVSDAESDPLDNQPGPTYRCFCIIDVTVT